MALHFNLVKPIHPIDLAELSFDHAAERLQGVVEHTPLVRVEGVGQACGPLDLRAKLENRQVCGAFKSRGAWNNVAVLNRSERARGVVTCSSGNHGRALAWAAQRAQIHATIVMPKDAYPNKIDACRELGAEVVLSDDREAAELDAASIAAGGPVLIHPYDRAGTVEGAGTVALEILCDWPEVELILVPVGGGGLVAGVSLCLRRECGDAIGVYGVEPAGAPAMHLGLMAGHSVDLHSIRTKVQGLCPMNAGELNVSICSQTLDGVLLVDDGPVFTAMGDWAARGERVEPAGAATLAAVQMGLIPAERFQGRSEADPLRVAIIVSGGNPSPQQWEEVQ